MYAVYRMIEEDRSATVETSVLKSFAAMSVDLIPVQVFDEVQILVFA